MAKAQIIASEDTTNVQIGQLVQEAIRVLPRNINLHVALDAGLERIERVDATSAFANISFVSIVTAADQPVDCLFGRLQEAQTPDGSSPSRYALFSLGQKVINYTAGEPGEVVKMAVQRLVPKLQTLLAAKLWRLTTNDSSSRLGVKSNLELVSAQKSVVMQQQTVRSQQQPEIMQSLKLLPTDASIPRLPVGSRIQYQICNQSDRPIYYLILGFDDHRNAIALYPQEQQNSSDNASILQDLDIAAGETIDTPVDFTWVLHAPASIRETQILCSRGKFTQTLAALQDAGDSRQEEHIGTMSNSLAVAQAILQDLHNASNNAAQANVVTADSYALDVNAWASFNFVYQVV